MSINISPNQAQKIADFVCENYFWKCKNDVEIKCYNYVDDAFGECSLEGNVISLYKGGQNIKTLSHELAHHIFKLRNHTTQFNMISSNIRRFIEHYIFIY